MTNLSVAIFTKFAKYRKISYIKKSITFFFDLGKKHGKKSYHLKLSEDHFELHRFCIQPCSVEKMIDFRKSRKTQNTKKSKFLRQNIFFISK